MNNKTQGAMLILTTILITSTLTYLLTKAKYQKRPMTAQPETKTETKSETKPAEAVNVTEYAERLVRKNQELIRDYIEDPDDHKEREIIDEDIFESNPEFDSVSFTLYADGVLTDEQNKIVHDLESTVGRDTIERFNALEHNNAVYIRNYKNKTDYEILRDLRSYIEVAGGRANGRS